MSRAINHIEGRGREEAWEGQGESSPGGSSLSLPSLRSFSCPPETREESEQFLLLSILLFIEVVVIEKLLDLVSVTSLVSRLMFHSFDFSSLPLLFCHPCIHSFFHPSLTQAHTPWDFVLSLFQLLVFLAGKEWMKSRVSRLPRKRIRKGIMLYSHRKTIYDRFSSEELLLLCYPLFFLSSDAMKKSLTHVVRMKDSQANPLHENHTWQMPDAIELLIPEKESIHLNKTISDVSVIRDPRGVFLLCPACYSSDSMICLEGQSLLLTSKRHDE